MPAIAPSIPRDAARIVCVDDYPTVCEAVRRGLDPRRFVFAGTVSEVASLDWLMRYIQPAILLLDVDMPGGERPLDWLARSAARYPSTRVVVYSAHAARDLVDRAVEAGAWGYIVKDDDPALLSDMLARVLRGEMVFSRSAGLF